MSEVLDLQAIESGEHVGGEFVSKRRDARIETAIMSIESRSRHKPEHLC